MKSKDPKIQTNTITRRRMLQTSMTFAGAFAFGIHKSSAKEKMKDLLIKRTSDWDELRKRLNGNLILRKEDIYQQRLNSILWNGKKTDFGPDAIVQVKNENDISEAILFAKINNLKVSVRGGGHSLGSPLPIRSNGILLDLSLLNDIEIDIKNKTAKVQPAVTGQELISKLSPLNLSFPVGHCPTVSLSGYLLNGGIGWNSGQWGLACMSVKGIELVNANGDLIYCDDDNNSDFFWAARGSGPGFFGIVTRYHLKLYDLPKTIQTSTFIFALKDSERVGELLPAIAERLQSNVELISSIATPPNKNEPVFIVNATAFCNSEEEAHSILKALEEKLGSYAVHKELYSTATMTSLLNSMDNLFPKGYRYGSDAFWSNSSPSEFVPLLKKCALESHSSNLLILFALSKSSENISSKPDMAFSMAGGAFIGVYGIWENEKEDKKNIDWLSRTAKQLEPYTAGYYIGECNLKAAEDRAKKCFSYANWEKLNMLKQKHDPNDIFFGFS